MTKLANHSSTYANRLLHPHSNQAIIGAWAVDMEGKVKTFDSLLHVRVGGMALHLTDPEHKVGIVGGGTYGCCYNVCFMYIAWSQLLQPVSATNWDQCTCL